MGVFIQDVERELYARIAPLQPSLAPRLAQRISMLPASEVAQVFNSEAALSRAVEWAICQETDAGLAPEAQATAPLSMSPLPTSSSLTPAAPAPLATMPLAQAAPLATTVFSGPLTTVAPRSITTCTMPPPTVTTTYAPAAPVTTVYRSVSPMPTTSQVKKAPLPALQGGSDYSASVRGAEEQQEPMPSNSLVSRVALLKPEMATQISEKILDLGPGVVNECVTSDWALQQRVDAAVGAIRREEAASRAMASPEPVKTAPAPPKPADNARGRSPVRRYAGRIAGLEDFMMELCLSDYLVQASDWAASMGAVSLEELLENQDDFADALGLRPLERARLQQSGMDVAASLGRLRQPQVGGLSTMTLPPGPLA